MVSWRNRDENRRNVIVAINDLDCAVECDLDFTTRVLDFLRRFVARSVVPIAEDVGYIGTVNRLGAEDTGTNR